jgi:hypothetical protein
MLLLPGGNVGQAGAECKRFAVRRDGRASVAGRRDRVRAAMAARWPAMTLRRSHHAHAPATATWLGLSRTPEGIMTSNGK